MEMLKVLKSSLKHRGKHILRPLQLYGGQALKRERTKAKAQPDFHKLFIVKINKMINKKTGAPFSVVHIIYGNLVYTGQQENCVLFIPPTAGFIPSMQV